MTAIEYLAIAAAGIAAWLLLRAIHRARAARQEAEQARRHHEREIHHIAVRRLHQKAGPSATAMAAKRATINDMLRAERAARNQG